MSIAERVTVADIVLQIRDLRLAFDGHGGWNEVLHGIGLHVRAGEKVALVGESGSGKSVTARIILGLVQEERAARIAGSVRFAAKEISAGGDLVREARGRRLSMIFQDPASALNPTFTIREQFRDVLRRAEPRLTNADADEKARQKSGRSVDT